MSVAMCQMAYRYRRLDVNGNYGGLGTLHIMPQIMLLLGRRNRLMQAVYVKLASGITVRINEIIQSSSNTALAGAKDNVMGVIR